MLTGLLFGTQHYMHCLHLLRMTFTAYTFD